MQYFDKKFHESKIYEIQNFIVKYYEPEEIERCYEDDKFIIFSCLTKVRTIEKTKLSIPSNIWKFTELSSIAEINDTINHFIGKKKHEIL